MKRCVDGTPFTIEKDLIKQGSNPVPLDQQARAKDKCAYFFRRSYPVPIIQLNSLQFTSREWWLDDFRFYGLSKVVQ